MVQEVLLMVLEAPLTGLGVIHTVLVAPNMVLVPLPTVNPEVPLMGLGVPLMGLGVPHMDPLILVPTAKLARERWM